MKLGDLEAYANLGGELPRKQDQESDLLLIVVKRRILVRLRVCLDTDAPKFHPKMRLAAMIATKARGSARTPSGRLVCLDLS